MAVAMELERSEGAPAREGPIDSRIDQKKATADVLEHFESSYAFLRPFFDRWLRFYRIYRCYQPPKTRPWRANIVIPVGFANIEHGTAVTMDAWSQRPAIRVLPREGTDYEGAQVVEDYLQWEDDDMSAYLARYEVTKELLMYGTSWGKVFWDWKAGRNQVDSVSVFNLFPDPAAESLEDAGHVIHRSLRSAGHIRRLAKMGVYEIEEADIERLAKAGLGFTMEGERLLGEVITDSRLWSNRIEVLEEWTDDWVTTVLNREITVRAHPNRFPHGRKPFLRYIDHAVPHELYGIGELEVIEKLVDELSDIRNQRLDIVSQVINNVLVASRMAGIDPEDLIMRPGGIIWANDVNAVRPLITQGANLAIGVQEEQITRFDIQEATGNWGYNQGQAPARRETATTVLALQRAAGTRFTAKVRWNEESALRQEARMRMENAQRFMPPSRWIRVTGKDPRQVSREQIQGVYDYIPLASSAEPKEIRRAQIAQILPYLLQSDRIRDDKFLGWLLDLFGVKEKEHFLRTDEEMQQVMLQKAMLTAGAKGAGGPGAGRMPTMLGAGGGPGETPQGLEDIAALSGEDTDLVSQLMGGATER